MTCPIHLQPQRKPSKLGRKVLDIDHNYSMNEQNLNSG